MEEHRFAELMAAALQGCRIPYTGRVWLGEEPKNSNSNGLHDGGSVQWADQQLHRQNQIRKHNKMEQEHKWQ